MSTDKASTSSIKELLEDARRRLVETGARNRLIHVNRTTVRANSLNIINERTEDVFDLLRVQGKRMRFLATLQDDEPSDEDDVILTVFQEDSEDFDPARYRDQFLETALGPEKLELRLLRLFTYARTSEEEQGFNILYLATGFLRWFESESSSVPREAPLILTPVQLVRNERQATFNLVARDDDIVTNLPLQERLRADFQIDLPEIEDNEDWRPEDYLNDIETLVSRRKRWSVDRNGMQLDFFSFAKLLMLRDLDPENRSDEDFQENPLLRGLLSEGFASESPLFQPQDRLDERLDPADIIQVIDADSSQTKVIEEIRSGQNFVVQGPPGTGKSQTIANVIASAVYDGKTVLFLAEKMAALNVVHGRLKRVNLDEICLELHSKSANKKGFIQEIERTLKAGAVVPSEPGDPEELRRVRDLLNGIVQALHNPVPGYTFTPFSIISEISSFIERQVPPPQLVGEGFLQLGEDERSAIADGIRKYAMLIAKTGLRTEHPFFGVGATDLQPPDLQRLILNLSEATMALRSLRDELVRACGLADLEQPETFGKADCLFDLFLRLARRPTDAEETAGSLLAYTGQRRMNDALVAGRAWRAARDDAGEIFSDVAWNARTADLRARIAPGVASFWTRLFGKYRGASAELAGLMRTPMPKSPGDRLALVDRLIDVQTKRQFLAYEEAWLSEALGVIWRGEKTDFAGLIAVAVWLEGLSDTGWLTDSERFRRLSALAPDSEAIATEIRRRIDGVRQALSRTFDQLGYADPDGRRTDDIPLDELAARLNAMNEGIERYSEWAQIESARNKLEDEGLSELVARFDEDDLQPDAAVDEFLYATAEVRWKAARHALPDLTELSHVDRHELVTWFRDLDRRRLEETRRLIRASHLHQLPTGAFGEMAFIRGEIAKKRRHLPIRKVIQRAGSMVQRIKPVFLMSPISVAQFLPPEAVRFDLLVIDEASQVKPEDALGAITRCSQIAVVGDQKQLPPTSFFDRISADGEDEDDEEGIRTARATEMESVLTLCEARGLNNGLLEWHYRSRDPSLIAVNNAEFYDHRLILPPSPAQNDAQYGLAFTRVPGTYSSRRRGNGRPGTNRIEAEAVAKRLAEHVRISPNLSVGVVAFSKAQSDMLTEVLEAARRNNPELEALLREDKAENVFVKNIENVQGDERDVILISVGYGPHEPNGRLATMSFGPVNSDGGERRLNVLFSRARIRCEVFCSFDPGEIDLSRTTKNGPAILKRFLEFAKTGELDQPAPTGRASDSPFEEDVAREIQAMGFECDSQVGSAGFRIDLGVLSPDQPGRYMLAVECDGARYHSALWARERDRLRQEVLEGMGWRFHRVWSTDWFYRRSDEVARLKQSLEEARAAVGPSFNGSNTERPVSASTEPIGRASAPENGGLVEPTLRAPRYRRAEIRYSGKATAPHQVSDRKLAKLVLRIIEAEGPLHEEEVARRVTTAFGLSRTGRRIREAVQGVLQTMGREFGIVQDGPFHMTKKQRRDTPVRDRSEESFPTARAEYLPPAEIRAAAVMVARESGRMSDGELVTATARLLGFARTGQDLRARIQAVLPARQNDM